jgi:hypothetical protein
MAGVRQGFAWRAWWVHRCGVVERPGRIEGRWSTTAICARLLSQRDEGRAGLAQPGSSRAWPTNPATLPSGRTDRWSRHPDRDERTGAKTAATEPGRSGRPSCAAEAGDDRLDLKTRMDGEADPANNAGAWGSAKRTKQGGIETAEACQPKRSDRTRPAQHHQREPPRSANQPAQTTRPLPRPGPLHTTADA